MSTQEETRQDRQVDRTDNQPPEALPQQLAPASEIGTVIKADVDAVREKAVFELDVFSRVPATIESDEIYQRATTLAARIKDANDDVEAKRKKHKRPYLDANAAIDEAFALNQPVEGGKPRSLAKEMVGAHAALKARLSDYDTRQLLAAEEAAAAEHARLAEQAARDGIEMSATAPAAALASTVRSAHGGHSVRKVVTEWEVEDEALLPRSVLSVDPAKVKAILDADPNAKIPGIRTAKKVDTHVKKK